MRSRVIENAKLFYATLLFLGSFGSLIVGTLAWFSSSSYLEIARFRIQMGEPELVELGLKVPPNMPQLGQPGDIVYYPNVDDDVLKSHEYYNPWMQFKASSSMFQSLWLDETTDLTDPDLFPQLRSRYMIGDNRHEGALATDNFYQFEFYVRSTVRIDMYLATASYVIANEAKNRETAHIQNLDANNLNKVEDALRISFLTAERFVIWEPNTDDAGTTEFGGRLDIVNYDKMYDYDPTMMREHMFGQYNGDEHLIYDESARVNSVSKNTSFNSVTAPGVSPLSIPLSKANGLVIATEPSVSKAFLTDTSNPDAVLLKLYPNEAQRLVVTVYAEGWDRDTTNAIHFASFAMNLAFGGRYAPL